MINNTTVFLFLIISEMVHIPQSDYEHAVSTVA